MWNTRISIIQIQTPHQKKAKQVKQTEQTNEYSAKQTNNKHKTLCSARQKDTHHKTQLEKTIKYIHRNKFFLVTNILSETKIHQKNNTSQT